jgi:hypothetical protein
VDGEVVTTLHNVEGTKGFQLPAHLLDSLSNNGHHTLTLNALTAGASAEIGVVPNGGGWPHQYSTSLDLWIGKAADLPTSTDDLSNGTFYVVADTAAHILGLSDFGTGALASLQHSSHIAYSTLDSVNTRLFDRAQNVGIELASISDVKFYGTATALQGMWNMSAAQTTVLEDSFTVLTSQRYSSAASSVSNNQDINNLWENGTRSAFTNHQVVWKDNLGYLNNPDNLQTMGALYHGNGQLQAVELSDSIATFEQLSSPSQISQLSQFVNEHANGNLHVTVHDSLDHLSDYLRNPSAIASGVSSLSQLFANIENVSFELQVKDTAAHLETAYRQTQTPEWQHLNINLSFSVVDSAENIHSLMLNDSGLFNRLSEITLVDTSSHLIDATQHNYGGALLVASTVIVQDTYSGIVANLDDLINISNTIVKHIRITDISGADANHPIVITQDAFNRLNGEIPRFEFADNSGLQGDVSITETTLGSQLTGHWEQSGVQIAVSDSAGHQVFIDVLSGSGNIDPLHSFTSFIQLPFNSGNSLAIDNHPAIMDVPDTQTVVADHSVVNGELHASGTISIRDYDPGQGTLRPATYS